jgi:glutamate synthase (NADPH/NADH) small chain
VGSGPAGLAAAAQLNQAGHWVTVFERADRIGGLLRYGIPEFKMEKNVLDRRLNIMHEEGIMFRTNANVGVNVAVEELRQEFDSILLAGGATAPRDLPVPGRELQGIHFAMEYLPLQNKRCEGDTISDSEFISAKDKRVVIIGGGDTGADCLGTAHRQGARSIVQFELLPKPPAERASDNPWPNWPNIFRTSSAHEEGGDREYSVMTKSFTGSNGHVTQLHAVRVEFEGRNLKEIPGTEFTLDADLVLLAMGFLGPQRKGMLDQLGVAINERGNVTTNAEKMTSAPGIFAAGDMARGQSLVVWAIREGRQAAKFIDKYLMGSSDLP